MNYRVIIRVECVKGSRHDSWRDVVFLALAGCLREMVLKEGKVSSAYLDSLNLLYSSHTLSHALSPSLATHPFSFISPYPSRTLSGLYLPN